MKIKLIYYKNTYWSINAIAFKYHNFHTLRLLTNINMKGDKIEKTKKIRI